VYSAQRRYGPSSGTFEAVVLAKSGELGGATGSGECIQAVTVMAITARTSILLIFNPPVRRDGKLDISVNYPVRILYTVTHTHSRFVPKNPKNSGKFVWRFRMCPMPWAASGLGAKDEDVLAT